MTTYKILKTKFKKYDYTLGTLKKSNSKLDTDPVYQLHSLNITVRTKHWMRRELD